MTKQFTPEETQRILDALFAYRQAAIDAEGADCELIDTDDVSVICYAINNASIADFGD